MSSDFLRQLISMHVTCRYFTNKFAILPFKRQSLRRRSPPPATPSVLRAVLWRFYCTEAGLAGIGVTRLLFLDYCITFSIVSDTPFFRKVVPLFDSSIWKSKFFISINFLAFFLWPLVSLLLKTSNSSTAQISLGSRTVERALSGRYVNHMKPFSDLPLGEREKLGLHSTATYSGLLLNGPITPEN